jgi:hypothetical protein
MSQRRRKMPTEKVRIKILICRRMSQVTGAEGEI